MQNLSYYAAIAQLCNYNTVQEMNDNVQRIARETGYANGIQALIGLSDDDCDELVAEAYAIKKAAV